MRKATPAICSPAPSTVLRRVGTVKSPNVSPSKTSSGKCSSALSRDNCASTGWLVLSDDFTPGGTGDGRATSSITFHSPGLPSPDTVLRKPGGGSLSLARSEEHTSELQSQSNLVCRLLLEKKKKNPPVYHTRIISALSCIQCCSIVYATMF